MDNLHNHLLRLDGRKHILSDCLLLDIVTELFRDPVTDIGIKQGPSDVHESLGNVDFRNLALSLEKFERPLYPF